MKVDGNMADTYVQVRETLLTILRSLHKRSTDVANTI